jgi:DNA polymerase-3 subunit epsilon
MTRGQDALLMESSDTQEPGLVVEQLDLRSMQLPVLEANAQEMAAHDDVLAQLDKSSGGKTVWKQMA